MYLMNSIVSFNSITFAFSMRSPLGVEHRYYFLFIITKRNNFVHLFSHS